MFSSQLTVRGYELDSYGHVNHAVYVNYLEHARWQLLEDEGITLADFKRWQRWPVIAGIQVQYIKPCFMGDALEVRSQVADHSKVRFSIDQEIYRGDTLVLKAHIDAVIVNEKGRPAELPPEMLSLWSQRSDAGGGI